MSVFWFISWILKFYFFLKCLFLLIKLNEFYENFLFDMKYVQNCFLCQNIVVTFVNIPRVVKYCWVCYKTILIEAELCNIHIPCCFVHMYYMCLCWPYFFHNWFIPQLIYPIFHQWAISPVLHTGAMPILACVSSYAGVTQLLFRSGIHKLLGLWMFYKR